MKWLHTLLLRGLLIAASLLCAGQAWAVCSYSPRMNLGDIVINPGLVRSPRMPPSAPSWEARPSESPTPAA